MDSGTAFDSDSGIDEDAPAALSFTGEVPRNILMISVDTTQVSYLGRYHDENTTPFLDSFLDDSMVLEHHRSCSNWTFASFLCVQGGNYDIDQGFAPETVNGLERAPDSLVLATEILGEAGYWQAIVSGNHFFSDLVNTVQGVDTVVRIDLPAPVEDVSAGAAEFFDEIAALDRPWYFHVHYMDPHWPYEVPKSYLEEIEDLEPIDYDLTNSNDCIRLEADFDKLDDATRVLVSQHLDVYYRAALRYFDQGLESFWQDLEAKGLTDDTLVVFFTDHGEELGEHGAFGHEVDLYLELTRSIAAFRAPGLTPGTWNSPTTHGDIWPTIFSLLEIDPGDTFRGVPVGRRTDSGPLYALKMRGNEDTELLVEKDGWRMNYHLSGERELFNLELDPAEQVDHYNDEPERVEELWNLLLPRVQSVEEARGYTATNPTP